MNNLGLASIALILSAIPAVGHAASDSMANAGATFAAGTSVVTQGSYVPRVGGRNWGGRHQGRWVGGWQAPGGWGGYRRPFTGYTLPRYWINPSFYISNYGLYGFSRPAQGYSWTRYYNDAVLADQNGRVADTVYDYDWDQYDSYDDARAASGSQGGYDPNYGQQGGGYGPQEGYGQQGGYGPPPSARPRDRDGGLGGALAGGAIGAIGGSIIAGRGDRTAGALIGGGLGALAGLAIDSNDRAGRGYGGGYGRPPGISKKEWKRWQKAQRAGYPGYPSAGYPNAGYPRYPAYPNTGYPSYPTYPGYPANAGQGGWGQQSGGGCATQQGGGNTVVVNQGYGNCTTTITIQSQPITTTKTTVTEEVIYERAATHRRVVTRKPKWRPRPKPRCVCGS